MRPDGREPASGAPVGRRVLVVGDSCTGKSTLGESLAQHLDAPHVELDALYWRPGWEPSPLAEFLPRVEEATRAASFVLSGNYSAQRDVSWPRADTLVWLDFPLRTTLPRILVRSWRRWRSHELLWGTNPERFWPQLKLWSPTDSLVAWTLGHHRSLRRRYEAALVDPAFAHLRVHRLCSPAAVRDWCAAAGLPPEAGSSRESGASPKC